MCGRYTIFTPVGELERRFDATAETRFDPRYNAAPGQRLPVIANDDPAAIRTARWGLIPAWADGDADGHVNARAETLAETPSFRGAYERRRCLVLADGFYEWPDDRDRPRRVTVDDGAFAMAGLWETWTPDTARTTLDEFPARDGPDASPDPVRTFTIVTTEPNALVAEFHDRMAAILEPDEERAWLETGDPALLDPYPADRMTAHPVSTAVNDPANDGPGLVAPVEE